MERHTLNAGFAQANGTSASRKSGNIAQRGIERVLLAVLLSAVVMAAGGCSGDSGTNPVPGGSQSTTLQQFTVDQTGGTVAYRSPIQDVTVTLTIPPGALNGIRRHIIDPSGELLQPRSETAAQATGRLARGEVPSYTS